jgi:hypothetical protein
MDYHGAFEIRARLGIGRHRLEARANKTLGGTQNEGHRCLFDILHRDDDCLPGSRRNLQSRCCSLQAAGRKTFRERRKVRSGGREMYALWSVYWPIHGQNVPWAYQTIAMPPRRCELCKRGGGCSYFWLMLRSASDLYRRWTFLTERPNLPLVLHSPVSIQRL